MIFHYREFSTPMNIYKHNFHNCISDNPFQRFSYSVEYKVFWVFCPLLDVMLQFLYFPFFFLFFFALKSDKNYNIFLWCSRACQIPPTIRKTPGSLQTTLQPSHWQNNCRTHIRQTASGTGHSAFDRSWWVIKEVSK